MNAWQYNRHVYQIYEDLQEPSNSYEKKRIEILPYTSVE